ncbi:hypothetical protein D7X88_19290 [bacterium C-53]|nr:hypothetical protein [Lachnospiraceae bacterium]NBI05051.1 hypothetical protein [Lachnospiraceae bacterium]RKJ07066.1 hypothetical protein D7X88_19290 [bacterium C-53]
MFDFRIIICGDGTEIIDRRIRTLYSELTPVEMMEYTEVDVQLEIMDRIAKRARKEDERKRKLARNLLRKLACFCGFV